MSAARSSMRQILTLGPNAAAGPSRAVAARLPPPFLLPRRSLFQLARRRTSFWAHSYPPVTSSSGVQIPYTPPSPAGPSKLPESDAPPADAKSKVRKQRYLDSLMDKAGELSLRCEWPSTAFIEDRQEDTLSLGSILDAEGNWRAEEGRYKKTELCKKYDLDPRDLRKLDSLSPNLVPIILTRRTCILISILHIRALIMPDRVIVFDTAGTVESEIQKRFKYHLERNIKAGLCEEKEPHREGDDEGDEVMLNYEHRALESILVASANALEEEMTFTRRLVQQLLADLEDNINRDNLKRLLHYSRRMVGFQSRARYVKRAVDEVLDNDEDLSAMYLTARAQGKPRALHDHEQLELLLESFVKQVEEIVSEVDNVVANMQSTQEIAELMLDSGRNALLALDIKISIATLGIGTGALVAGFFGMNVGPSDAAHERSANLQLTSDLEHSSIAFFAVSGTAAVLAFLVFAFGMRTLRRVRRVALSGPRRPQYHMARLIGMPGYPLAAVDPLTGAPRPTFAAEPSLRDRLAIWKWFRRSRAAGVEPVWINEKADLARARDAMRAQQIADKTDLKREWEQMKEEKMRRWKEMERSWKGEEGEWNGGGWESGPWKWGRGKHKWAKE